MKNAFLALVVLFAGLSEASASHIKRGDRVLLGNTSSFSVGFVVDTYSNGQAEVRFDGFAGTWFRSISSLSKATTCQKGLSLICTGDTVILGTKETSSIGKVLEVFENGMAVAKFHGFEGKWLRSVEKMGKSVRCDRHQNVCVGDKVTTGSGNRTSVGTVHKVFSNGVSQVAFKGFAGLWIRTTSKLAKISRCSGASSCH